MGTLSNEEKARSVLCRTGRPGNECAYLESSEVDELAVVCRRRSALDALELARILEHDRHPHAHRLAAGRAG